MTMIKNEEKKVNINEPGAEPEEESPYYDSEAAKEEQEKVPVEYLGYLEKKKESRREQIVFWILILIIIFGLAPGTRGMDYCPRSGEWRSHFTFAWGRFNYIDPVIRTTEWTEWYLSKNPEPHPRHWVPYDKVYPALFGYLTTNWGARDLGWEIPENLVERMTELDGLFRPGYVLEIPRALNSVNKAREWNAIILPLTVGMPRQAYAWWNNHRSTLMAWSREEIGTPLPEEYIAEAMAYVKEMTEPEGNHIPLIRD